MLVEFRDFAVLDVGRHLLIDALQQFVHTRFQRQQFAAFPFEADEFHLVGCTHGVAEMVG